MMFSMRIHPPPTPVPTEEELSLVEESAFHVAMRLRDHQELRPIAPMGPLPREVTCKRCGRSVTIGYRDGKLDFWGDAIREMCRTTRPRSRR